ncbi:MAG: carbohydrate kinase [Lachnospiraceae bacterium]|nr:carbohydrate kinase [Lachnospiraceae bacterium]
MKKFDVIALGELLIDMTDNGVSGQGNTLFEANPGGAPCNVLAMLTKLGYKTGFIGKVGEDLFGRKLKSVLEEVGIDTSNLCVDTECRTTLAFVETKEGGDRDFSFYRNPGADMQLKKEDIHVELLEQTKLFHFGTLSMTHEEVREATRFAVEYAKEQGALISFDPNIREPLWSSMDLARKQVEYGLGMCDILKISDNEIVWLTGEEDYSKGVAKLKEKYDIPLILVSMGKEGSRAYYKDSMVEKAAFVQPNTIETTGAGDTFMGCVLHKVLQDGLENLKEEQLDEMLTFANAAASLITTRKGALRVMPEEHDIREMIG